MTTMRYKYHFVGFFRILKVCMSRVPSLIGKATVSLVDVLGIMDA